MGGKTENGRVALIAEIFHLDAKIEEMLKKNLKISLALLESLLTIVSRRVEFYTPEVHHNIIYTSQLWWEVNKDDLDRQHICQGLSMPAQLI